MKIFNHDEYVEYTFQTDVGRIGAIAMVHIMGNTLLLEGIDSNPIGVDRLAVGVRALMQMARDVEQLAKLDGFTRAYY